MGIRLSPQGRGRGCEQTFGGGAGSPRQDGSAQEGRGVTLFVKIIVFPSKKQGEPHEEI